MTGSNDAAACITHLTPPPRLTYPYHPGDKPSLEKTAMKRFWDKVLRTDDCWLWQASKDQDGYGMFHFQGRVQRAHRVAWMLENNRELGALYVLHSCDNPSCCNPSHLCADSQASNMADMASKGRASCRKGAENPATKLTKEQVSAIRASTESQRALAKIYGVSQPAISYIKRGLTHA